MSLAARRFREAREARTRENEAYYWLAGGAYVDHIGVWFDGFGNDLAVWFFEHMAQDAPGFVAKPALARHRRCSSRVIQLLDREQDGRASESILAALGALRQQRGWSAQESAFLEGSAPARLLLAERPIEP